MVYHLAYGMALESLIVARFSLIQFEVSAFLLRASLGKAQCPTLRAEIPDLKFIEEGTGVAHTHCSTALKDLIGMRIFSLDGKPGRGNTFYGFNPVFSDWKLSGRKLARNPNVAIVSEQLRFEYDDWVRRNGPLADANLEIFVANCWREGVNFGSSSADNVLCGGQRPRAFSERPAFTGGKKEYGVANPSAGPDGSHGIPVAAATQTTSVVPPSESSRDGKRVIHTAIDEQGNFKAPLSITQKQRRGEGGSELKASDAAWQWLVSLDKTGPVQKLSDAICAQQWQELCVRDPDYILDWLSKCWRHRSGNKAKQPIQNPMSYLSRVALNDRRLRALPAAVPS